MCVHDIVNEKMKAPKLFKATNSLEAVETVHRIVCNMSSDFVCTHNGFEFDMMRMAAHSAFNSELSHLFETRRLGNSGTDTRQVPGWHLDRRLDALQGQVHEVGRELDLAREHSI